MFILSICLCGVSINYFNKDSRPWSLGAQLYLIFFNCVPRPFHGFIYSILEILAHIYLQELTRNFNVLDELPYKIFVLDILGIFFPALLEYSGLISSPHFLTDFTKYNILYLFNFLYTFFIEGETIRYIVIGIQLLLILIYILNYFRKTLKLTKIHSKAKQIYSMSGSSVEDALNFVVVQQDEIYIMSFVPKKQVHRQMNITSNNEFVGYAHIARAVILYDKQNYQFKTYDTQNFNLICTIQSENNISYIVHAQKNLIAVFSLLPMQEGTLINVYDCTTGEQKVSVGLSHRINQQENMWIFDSFALDLEKTSDRLIFSYEKLLCSLDIDTKVNESLSSNFTSGFTLYKANQRRIIFSGKEDWAEMYDVPTNQPASLNSIYLSYSRIIPIQNLNDYYFVEPCCSKKNVYIMKGYGSYQQIQGYFQLGYPNIICAIYSKETNHIVFIDKKKKYVYQYPFAVHGRDTSSASNDFEDSIIALD